MAMRPSYDTVELEYSGNPPKAGVLLRTLWNAHRLCADAVSAIHCVGDRIFIDFIPRYSRTLRTPCPIVSGDTRFVLRRDTDIVLDEPISLVTVNAEYASAGELATLCYEGAGIAGEDIGFISAGDGVTKFQLSAWRYQRDALPSMIGESSCTAEKKSPARANMRPRIRTT